MKILAIAGFQKLLLVLFDLKSIEYGKLFLFCVAWTGQDWTTKVEHCNLVVELPASEEGLYDLKISKDYMHRNLDGLIMVSDVK